MFKLVGRFFGRIFMSAGSFVGGFGSKLYYASATRSQQKELLHEKMVALLSHMGIHVESSEVRVTDAQDRLDQFLGERAQEIGGGHKN
jgi:hypothetical protein